MAVTEAQIKLSTILRDLAGAVNEIVIEQTGKDFGFCMVFFNQEEKGQTQYISNCKREHAIEALNELLENWQAIAKVGEPDMPLHEKKGDL